MLLPCRHHPKPYAALANKILFLIYSTATVLDVYIIWCIFLLLQTLFSSPIHSATTINILLDIYCLWWALLVLPNLSTFADDFFTIGISYSVISLYWSLLVPTTTSPSSVAAITAICGLYWCNLWVYITLVWLLSSAVFIDIIICFHLLLLSSLYIYLRIWLVMVSTTSTVCFKMMI